MCGINADGNLVLKDNTVVKDISKLKKHQIDELFNEQASRWELAQIMDHLKRNNSKLDEHKSEVKDSFKHLRQNMHGIRGDLQNQTLAVGELLEETKKHTIGCPVNPTEIKRIAEREIAAMLDEMRDEKSEAGKRFNMRILGVVKNWITTSILTTANILKALFIIGASIVGLNFLNKLVEKLIGAL